MRMDLDGMYAAIDNDGAFQQLSSRIAEAAGTRSAVFVELTAAGAPTSLQANYWDQDVISVYLRRFVAQDPWTALAVDIGNFGRATALDARMSPDAFRQTEIYNDLYRPYGDDTGRCMGVIPHLGREGVMMAVHRAASDEAFSAQDQARLDEIYGHIQRILPLRRAMERQRHRASTLQDLVDQADEGLVRLGRDLRVLALSSAAQRILEQRDGLSLSRNHLVARPELEGALRAAVAAVIDRRVDARTGFLCHRPSGARAYRLVVMPAGFDGDAGAILKIDDPDISAPVTAFAALQGAYGLSAMETVLVQGLLADHTPEEIAAQRGVGRETIKTQMKALFAKTGVNRQSSLIRLFATFPRMRGGAS
ncbi:hypothetical protein GTZ99_02595 [Novosphingobium sp. FSY-8]|uniref:HTH luxR-type domain-containing protein n=1 Tax=Novosphingobium ovatum TaxID=1908523 RepID=A0ABW9XA81_9SPHN|nr:helix-turn-helix transcriptional regulator [Novosphingobium ovatum]NBC35442.1 hypothetical protein [Novosphingobium ovatum]